MELFTLDSSVETNDIKLTVSSEILMFWIHFASFHLHWRGCEMEKNEDIDDVEREHLQHELQFFDFLYHKFLMYVPEAEGGKYLTTIPLPIEIVEKIFYELEDFIQYCQVYGEDELLTITKNYKSTFATLFQDCDPNTRH
ncbi:hypothetical protein M3175_12610 [Robertmurraya korlensis]|uniref:hypothetical protein n=1 Tax=Robertmurraya korlensis TaxID=519977 RepID=UPI00203E9107|nr:hypothetical protein [Robertmurraya korlensis]MCM3601579.1 hypothetical protein [Robertmurraya korlensis]